MILVDFLTTVGWGAIKILSSMDEFRNLDRDIETNAKRWKKFVEAECPEKVGLRLTIDINKWTAAEANPIKLLYDNDFTSIIDIYFYESFSTPNLK